MRHCKHLHFFSVVVSACRTNDHFEVVTLGAEVVDGFVRDAETAVEFPFSKGGNFDDLRTKPMSLAAKTSQGRRAGKSLSCHHTGSIFITLNLERRQTERNHASYVDKPHYMIVLVT